MTRYKTITFDDFSDGQQCDILEPNEKSFKASENLVIRKGKVKLGWKIRGSALVDSLLYEIGSSTKASFLYSNSIYFAASNGGASLILKKCNTSGTLVTVYTFSDSLILKCLIKFRGLAIASYTNNAEALYLCKYSTDGMTMANWANTNLIGKIGQHYIRDYKIIHDRLYILTENCRLLYSDDGITFHSLVTLDSSYTYKYLEYLDGYLYVSNNSSKSVYGLVRLSLSGEIQDEIVSIPSIYNFTVKAFLGKLYILIDNKFLFRIDGSSLVPIYQFDNRTRFIFDSSFYNFLPLFDYVNYKLYFLNSDEKVFSPYKYISAVNAFHLYYYPKAFAICTLSGNAGIAVYENKYTSSGNVQTYEFRSKQGSFVPIQATILNKPLTANAWIKVYVKKDGASAWGSAVIDSADLDAVKKSYDFPAGDELRTIEFKIELGTDDDAETPEDPKLEFVYLPIGLANSK